MSARLVLAAIVSRTKKGLPSAGWVVRNGAEGPFRTFQERILADTIQNVLLFKADVTYT